MRCEDFPCCGHEAGCCPDFDESGKQLNMKCTCGATLPIDSRFSICDSCLNDGEEEFGDNGEEEFDDLDESMDGDFDSGMASAGFGKDEDYHYDSYEPDFGYDG